ncbi:MAG: hypothetical protein AAF311_15985, partial [Pseudomonadota bacterium]
MNIEVSPSPIPNSTEANLTNALVLIAMSAWAYLAAANQSVTILIPMAAGIILLLCQPGVKS